MVNSTKKKENKSSRTTRKSSKEKECSVSGRKRGQNKVEEKSSKRSSSRSVTPQPPKKTKQTEQQSTRKRVQSKVVIPKPSSKAIKDLATDFDLQDEQILHVGEHLGDNVQTNVNASEDDFLSDAESGCEEDQSSTEDRRNVVDSSQQELMTQANNPMLKQLFEQWYEERTQKEKDKERVEEASSSNKNEGRNSNDSRNTNIEHTPKRNKGIKESGDKEMIKSPSDTTLYAPGLRKNNLPMGDQSSNNPDPKCDLHN